MRSQRRRGGVHGHSGLPSRRVFLGPGWGALTRKRGKGEAPAPEKPTVKKGKQVLKLRQTERNTKAG